MRVDEFNSESRKLGQKIGCLNMDIWIQNHDGSESQIKELQVEVSTGDAEPYLKVVLL